jgi:hypothetical protein
LRPKNSRRLPENARRRTNYGEQQVTALTTIRETVASDHLNFIRGLAAIAVLQTHARVLLFASFDKLESETQSILIKGFYLLAHFGHLAVLFFLVVGVSISILPRRRIASELSTRVDILSVSIGILGHLVSHAEVDLPTSNTGFFDAISIGYVASACVGNAVGNLRVYGFLNRSWRGATTRVVC